MFLSYDKAFPFFIPVSDDTNPLSFLFPHGLLESLEGLHDPSVAAIQIYISYIKYS
jgi:hypothetical protein